MIIDESKLRQQLYISFPNVSFIFNNHKLTKDFLRELILQLDQKSRNFLEQQLVEAATIVKVLTTEFLYNSINYIEDGMVIYWKDRLEEQHALAKFKYRYDYQLSPQYKRILDRKFITLADQTQLDFYAY